jgi:hypothetical protein
MYPGDIVDTSFHCLKPHQAVAEAVKLFQEASRAEGKKIFGMTEGRKNGIMGKTKTAFSSVHRSTIPFFHERSE